MDYFVTDTPIGKHAVRIGEIAPGTIDLSNIFAEKQWLK